MQIKKILQLVSTLRSHQNEARSEWKKIEQHFIAPTYFCLQQVQCFLLESLFGKKVVNTCMSSDNSVPAMIEIST